MAKYLYLGPPTTVTLGKTEITLAPGCQFDADANIPYVKRLVAKGLAQLVTPENASAPVVSGRNKADGKQDKENK